RPDLDAPALGILHAVEGATDQQAIVEAGDQRVERRIAGCEEGVRHARVCLALDRFPSAVGRARDPEAGGGVEVGDAALEDAVADDGRAAGKLALVVDEVRAVRGGDGRIVEDVDQLGADAPAHVVRGAGPLLDEHVRLHAVTERLVRDGPRRLRVVYDVMRYGRN